MYETEDGIEKCDAKRSCWGQIFLSHYTLTFFILLILLLFIDCRFVTNHAHAPFSFVYIGPSPILVTTSAGSGPNLQMVRTVLSQPAGLKPGQAILISQPTLQSTGTVIPQAQVLQVVQ